MMRRPLSLLFAAFLTVFVGLQAYWFLPSLLRRPLLFQQRPAHGGAPGKAEYHSGPFPIDESTGCPSLPGIQDVLVILKTSAVVVDKLLPAHLNTSLRCIPNYVIYSDLEEDVDGHHVYNVLKEAEFSTQVANSDFDLYKQLQLHGRADVGVQQLDSVSEAVRNLDKWKYLPIIEKSLQHKSDAAWYILTDTGSFILWTTLAQWLSRFDSSEPQYLGAPRKIEDQIFAHGGSGIVLSRPAMMMAAEQHANHLGRYDEVSLGQCTGDCALGKLLRDAGVLLRPQSWPILQSQNPLELDHAAKVSKKQRAWCYPAASYDRMASEDINNIWLFELERQRKSNSSVIRHADVFQHYMIPRLPFDMEDWDNLSGKTLDTDDYSGRGSTSPSLESMTRDELKNSFVATSYDACKAKCESQPDCMQFSYSPGECHNSKVITLGHSNITHPLGIRSGWLLSRIMTFSETMPPCDDVEKFWIT